MPAYKPGNKNICSGLFAGGENEAGFEYFIEKSGEETIIIMATGYITLPTGMRVLSENKCSWVKAGSGTPTITPRENIVLMPELDVNMKSLSGVSISEEIKEADRGKYLRLITSTTHKGKLYIRDEHALILKKAMYDNDELELFVDQGKKAGIYLIGASEIIYAFVPEWQEEQLDINLDALELGKTIEIKIKPLTAKDAEEGNSEL